MVGVLAKRRDDGIGAVRTAEIAVLFADIVGFTKLAETLPPERTVEMLRKYSTMIEMAVFDHHGTLDKYLGDGVMATFGTPEPGPQDALNAVRAARQIVAGIDAVNAVEPNPVLRVRVSVGVHFGTVTLGTVGPARRLEFAVLGDTVNVASRLEAASRDLGCQIVCSNAVIRRAGADPAVDAFANRPDLHLRGRNAAIDVWTYDSATAQSSHDWCASG
jgi:adenylate cyclase